MSSGGRLGELLVRENLISLAQLQRAHDEQRQSGERLGYTLTKLGFIDETELTQFLSKAYGVPSISLADFDIKREVIDLVPKEVATRHLCIPVNRAGGTLIVAMADPSNLTAIDDLKFLTSYNIEVVVASEAAIREAITKYYEKGVDVEGLWRDLNFDDADSDGDGDGGGSAAIDLSDLTKSADDAPVVRLCNLILVDAIKRNASDIHVEPYEKEMRVRYPKHDWPIDPWNAVASRGAKRRPPPS